MNPITLPRITTEQATVRRRVGCGIHLPLTLPNDAGLLELNLYNEPPSEQEDGHWFSSAAGPLWLSDAGALLSLLGEVPVVLQGEAQAWYWPMIDQGLCAQLQACLAPLRPASEVATDVALVHGRLRASMGENTLYAQLRAPASTWMNLLDHAAWQPVLTPLDESLPLPAPLVLGTLQLSLEQLASLRVGDVLLPPHMAFDSEGNGRLELAGQPWQAVTAVQDQRVLVQLNLEDWRFDDH